MSATTMGTGRRIRVLQLGGPAGMFGAERWILALARYLPATEVETVVGVIQDMPGGGPAPLCAHAAQLGLPTVQFEAPGRLSVAAIGQLRRFIRDRQVDIVHSHGYKSDLIGVLATRGLPCRLVSTPHGWSTDAGIKLQVYEALDRLAFAGCDAIAPLSDDLAAGLARLPWARRRTRLIPNGVDLSEVTDSDRVAAEVGALRAGGVEVFGYIGQLISRKRIDTLIRAFASLPGEHRRLYLIGDGPERAELEALAESLGQAGRIRFTGFRDDRLEFLRGFDLFVLPSSLEGIPRCVMEAMAAGIPVVASDIEGTRTLVKDGETGLLFEVGDHAGLAAQIERLMGDPALRARLAAAARALVQERFSAARMAGDYLRLYRDVLDREGRTRTRGLRHDEAGT
ncbi:MAG: glycosyltransferase [Burkholderiaceae bacterium]|nr:glycosyltransferase [Burkholderiaceae bacterium]